jgi:hypothetical protein
MRVDETVASPLTNIQQVVSRGNPAWKWTYEYTNLSESEREVVQAFLLNCRGSLNTFKVSDPADYSIRGSLSDWTDVYSGYGSFTSAGSDTTKVNSWFNNGSFLESHVTDERMAVFEWRADTTASEILTFRGVNPGGYVSIQSGAIYAAQIKHFAKDYNNKFYLNVRSDGSHFLRSDNISSEGIFTMPFPAGYDTSEQYVSIAVDDIPPALGKRFATADWRLVRAAMIVNTENLFTYSNDFSNAAWSVNNASVESGTTNDPIGGDNWWTMFVNSDDASGTHSVRQSVTIPQSNDMHTVDFYAKYVTGLPKVMVELNNGDAYSRAYFDLSVGSMYQVTDSNSYGFSFGKIYSAREGAYRLQVTAHVNSDTPVLGGIFLVNSDDAISFATTDSCYIRIAYANYRKSPVIGPALITTDTTVVASSENWTGSKVVFSGFDPGDIIKAGQRLELINQYYDDVADTYERSEFKRVTDEVKVGLEGHAFIEFDPPIRNAPTANYSRFSGGNNGHLMHPVAIFHQPEMKARLLGGTIQYIDKPLRMTDIVFDVLEDLTE